LGPFPAMGKMEERKEKRLTQPRMGKYGNSRIRVRGDGIEPRKNGGNVKWGGKRSTAGLSSRGGIRKTGNLLL